MAISIKKYVDIKSGINNIKTATEKELIARIFSADERLEPRTVYEFDNSSDVRDFFGSDSEEYEIAKRYFSFINKYSRKPKKISFYRDWRDGINAEIISSEETTLADLKLITSGSLKLSINNVDKTISTIDLSSATSFGDVASTLQTAIRAVASSNEDMYSDATVTVDTDGIFSITSGIKDYGKVNIVEETTLSEELKLDRKVEGRPEAEAEDIFKESYETSNNFATYYFIEDSKDDDLFNIQKFVDENYPSEFMFVFDLYTDLIQDIEGFVNSFQNANGVSLEMCSNGKYNFIIPMAITATTDYNKENGTVNYMYTQFNDADVVVDDDNEAEQYDELKINYYGQTQKSGQKLAFYQNGVLQGNYQDQNIYVNEIWLKDALTTKYLNYMLLTPNWYANKAGQAIGQGLAMDVIERAKLNGTITTEKEISEEDKVYIYSITSDENAWRQIYQEGYYLTTYIDKKTINSQTTYTFNYVLLYSKGDSIKKVEGLNILI